MSFDIKPFPIPVVADLGPGSQADDDGLDYLRMPSGMDTYQPPRLPEPEELVGHDTALQVLHQVLGALRALGRGEPAAPVSLAGLPAEDLTLVNQVLGEGEVSAQVLPLPGQQDQQPPGRGDASSAPRGGVSTRERPVVDTSTHGTAHIQESVFAGVWRVLHTLDDGQVVDSIEVGPVPAVLREAAREDARRSPARLAVPAGMFNIPAVLTELEDHRQHWRAGQMAQVVNLTLLPLTPEDIGFMDHQLGTGRVLILSRGYGNCRITNCCVANTWRVVYYNSQDAVILNSVEVCDMPEVACAAPEDLADSAERLVEVLQWVEQAGAAS